MKTVDHSYEQALIMHDNVHIHVIMNIIMTPRWRAAYCLLGAISLNWTPAAATIFNTTGRKQMIANVY